MFDEDSAPFDELEVGPAERDEIDAIVNVLTRSVRELCAEDYDHDQELLDRWCSNKTPANIERWINHSESELLCARTVDEGVVGVGMVQFNEPRARMVLCYVSPDSVGRGVGDELVEALECAALERGLFEMELSSTITAQGFYERKGYRAIGQLGGDIPSIPMLKEL